jgi:hypothetical protein
VITSGSTATVLRFSVVDAAQAAAAVHVACVAVQAAVSARARIAVAPGILVAAVDGVLVAAAQAVVAGALIAVHAALVRSRCCSRRSRYCYCCCCCCSCSCWSSSRSRRCSLLVVFFSDLQEMCFCLFQSLTHHPSLAACRFNAHPADNREQPSRQGSQRVHRLKRDNIFSMSLTSISQRANLPSHSSPPTVHPTLTLQSCPCCTGIPLHEQPPSSDATLLLLLRSRPWLLRLRLRWRRWLCLCVLQRGCNRLCHGLVIIHISISSSHCLRLRRLLLGGLLRLL